MSTIEVESEGEVLVVTINRPAVRNAIDGPTAAALAATFRAFDRGEHHAVAVLTGAAGTFCAGADLKALASGSGNPFTEDGDGPLGPTRFLLTKPVIAAVEGHAVAGGLELALWCDLRVAATDAIFGVYCRRFGVPLCDLGTGGGGDEALRMGLVNRLVPPGETRAAAIALAHELARFPQSCLRSDRLSAYEQWSLPFEEAMRNEARRGLEVVGSGETRAGAERFTRGVGRHGTFGEKS